MCWPRTIRRDCLPKLFLMEIKYMDFDDIFDLCVKCLFLAFASCAVALLFLFTVFMWKEVLS